MTNDDIIRMAHEAGLHIATDVNWMPIVSIEYAKKFAEVVRAEEREACAKTAMELLFVYIGSYPINEQFADAIRARGQQ